MAKNDDGNYSDGDSGKGADKGSSSPWAALIKGVPQMLYKAGGQSKNILEMTLKAPEYLEQLGKAGKNLRDLREVSKLTVEDLASALDLENPDLLRAIEEGRSPITLDILFRLASFYSRNDPMTFMLSFSKEYAPWLWYVLRVTGMEKMLITIERELKFINIYRSQDAARDLSDEEFEKVLGFTRKSFDMAVEFIAKSSSEQDKEKSTVKYSPNSTEK